MSIFVRPNTAGLITYLERYNIDANRAVLKTLSPEGYDYIAQYPDGRPVYHGQMQLTWDRHPWPSMTVYENVQFLLGGGSLQDIKPDDVIEEEQPKPVDDPPPTPPKEKLATPAESKPRTVRKKVSK